MSRLPAITREQLGPEDRPAWDRIMAGRSGGGGPYGILAYVPAMAERLSAVESYFRDGGTLAAPDKELIILATARELGARFPWSRHEIRARQVGVRSEAIETLRAEESLNALTPHERLLVEVVRSLLRERSLSDDLFLSAQAELGNQRLVEIVGLVSHYNMISSVANTFDLGVPADTVTF